MITSFKSSFFSQLPNPRKPTSFILMIFISLQSNPPHHYVRRRKQEGKCDSCGKGFQSMLSYKAQKEVAISCSWCKKAYHIKSECSKGFLLETTCTLGCHRNLVLPPSWIVKLPPRKVRVN